MLSTLVRILVAGCLQTAPSISRIEPPVPTVEERMGNEQKMIDAAKAFVASLDDGLRARVVRTFDDPLRRSWSYLRGERPGLPLAVMSAEQRALALKLAQSVLSDEGRERVRLIRANEDISRADEIRRRVEPTYGGDLYAILIFGEPGKSPWGWRLEGHHIGLHFSSLSGETTTTPLFFGAFPASLADGPEKGKRPLGALQDAALELRRALTPEQAKAATIGDAAPADVITGPGRESALRDASTQGGIAMTDLTAAQRDLLWGLVLRHALDLRGDLASDELRRIKAAGTERIRFGWAGEAELTRPHYYRIAGPTFVIEFDCTQDNPNHVHCVWNDPERNFGGDPLREHVQTDHETRKRPD